MALRDFIYIDKNRMYSLYSQLFEGVVESLVRSVSYSTEEQKKDRKLEESIIDASVKVQNVVLFDHIYNTLEDKMKSHLLIVDKETTKDDIKPTSIVKITGYVTIEDYNHLSYLMSNINEIGLALSYLQLINEKGNVSNNSIEKHAKENGLNFDKKFTSSIIKVIENFHGKTMEIIIESDSGNLNVGFKALLNEEFLRISPDDIRNLYGYKPCMKWTMVGEVTEVSYLTSTRSVSSKSAFSDLFMNLNEVDKSFSKVNEQLNDMIRIAPIAVYIEHENITAAAD
ncbi:MAG: hypothetical protein MSH60_02005 [Ruminococcus sp.]|nr:hypothetical protein [Ruminococcus sp.]